MCSYYNNSLRFLFSAFLHIGFNANSLAFIDNNTGDTIKQLNADICELTSEKVRMLQLLEEKDRQFVELENHALQQEKNYLSELKVRHRFNIFFK